MWEHATNHQRHQKASTRIATSEARVSTAECITRRRPNRAHDVIVAVTYRAGERLLDHRMETIAVDNGSQVQPDFHIVDVNFGGETRNDVVTSATVARSRTSRTSVRVPTSTGRHLRPTGANQESPRFKTRPTLRPRSGTCPLVVGASGTPLGLTSPTPASTAYFLGFESLCAHSVDKVALHFHNLTFSRRCPLAHRLLAFALLTKPIDAVKAPRSAWSHPMVAVFE